MTDIGNQREVERRNKALRIPAGKLKDAVRWVMSDPRGRFYLAHLVDESGALKRGISGNTDGVLFEQGVREMGLKVLEDVRALDEAGKTPTQMVALLSAAIAATPPKKEDDDGDRTDAG